MTLNVVGMFCEDIREEKSGQVSIIGILPDNINIPSSAPHMPTGRAAIPKLGVYIRIHLGVDYDPGPMSLKLLLPDGVEIDLGAIEMSLVEKSKKEARAKLLPIAGLVSQAVLMGFVLPGPGIITAVLEVGQIKHVCAVLNAQLIPASNASEQPDSKSQPVSPKT